MAGSLVSLGGALVSGAVVVVGAVGLPVVEGVTLGPGGVTGTGPDVEGGMTGGATEVVVDGLLPGATGVTTGSDDVGVTLGVVVEVVGATWGLPASVSPQPATNSRAKHEAPHVLRQAREAEKTGAESTDDKRMSGF